MNATTSMLCEILPSDCDGPVFVHANLFKANAFIEKSTKRNAVLEQHLEVLRAAAEGRDLWLPSFNYQFPTTRHYDVRTSISQVGPLPEHFRTRHATWRTYDPIFSVSGTGPNPERTQPPPEIIAFDSTSSFARLTNDNGIILFYGTDLTPATIIHHVERLTGVVYRYDKEFTGTIVNEHGVPFKVKYVYHVRPRQQPFGYCWDTLLDDLTRDRISRMATNHLAIALPAKGLTEYWLARTQADPFYFLDKQTKPWVIARIQSLGRRFVLNDFE